MEAADQLQPPTLKRDIEAKQVLSAEKSNHLKLIMISWILQRRWCFQVTTYTLLLLSGQTVGILLGRLYFNEGGKSTWIATLVQTLGFPILIPFLYVNKNAETSTINSSPSILVRCAIYTFLGLCIAANCVLYSLGLKYLPVSTYSLVCASQLAFNAVFAFFLNAQKLTFLIINSLVLLTISSVVLVLLNDPEDRASTSHFGVGITCTVAASALYAFVLSFTELMFQRVLKGKTFRLVLDLTIYETLCATVAIVVGLIASGEWTSFQSEMRDYKLGKASYVMTLFWTAISWQVFGISNNALIFKVSSLFSNVIGVVGLPVTPVLAVMVFRDKVTAPKVVALVLALWGFISYVYQHYLDDLKAKAEKRSSNNESDEISIVQIN